MFLKLENETFRAKHATNKGQTGNFRDQNSKLIPAAHNIQFTNRQKPPTHTRNYQYQQHGQPPPIAQPRQNCNNFSYQPTAATGQPFLNRQCQPVAPPRSMAQNTLPRLEPLDVDPRVQTIMVYNMN